MTPGGHTRYGASCIFDAAVLSMEPQLAAGAFAPRPKKLNEASAATAEPRDTEITSTTGGITFGRTCRTITRIGRHPSATADSMYVS